MQVRGAKPNEQAKTPPSKWHTVRRWWAHHWLERDAGGEWKSKWGRSSAPRRRRAKGSARERRREDARIARHAQDVRAEATTKGGKEEAARYYGTGEHAGRGAGRVEKRIRVSDADAAERAPERRRAARRVTVGDGTTIHYAATATRTRCGVAVAAGELRTTKARVTCDRCRA